MGNLHGLFYSVGAIAGITAAALCAVLVMWTLRDAGEGASGKKTGSGKVSLYESNGYYYYSHDKAEAGS